MKTTLEIPDELMRQVKLRAVHDNRKLKDVVAELLARGLGVPVPDPKAPPEPPRPALLRSGKKLTIEDIEGAIDDGRS